MLEQVATVKLPYWIVAPARSIVSILFLYIKERRDQGDEHADMDFKDLKRLTVECEGWIRTARLLIQDVMGDDFVFEDASAALKGKESDIDVATESGVTAAEVNVT